MKKTNLRTTALFTGTVGSVYQPKVNYTGGGIKWYPEKYSEKKIREKK